MNTTNKENSPAKGKRRVPWLLLTTGAAAVALVALIVWPGAPETLADEADIVVYKTPSCSCCKEWIKHLESAGMDVNVVNVNTTQPVQARVGVPRALGSCHTAVIGDYWIEGHVPVDLILKLAADKPDNIRGLAVPGMVVGSPGMEGPNSSTYDIVALDSSGRAVVHATREGRSE